MLIWGLCVRIISGRHPRLYSYQNSLPRMNVPPLRSTVSKFLDSVKPLLDKEEYEDMEKNSKVSNKYILSNHIFNLKKVFFVLFCFYFQCCTLREESNAEETFAIFVNSGKFAKVCSEILYFREFAKVYSREKSLFSIRES